MAIQMAKAIGAKVLTTAGGSERCARCVELGADAAIDYRTHDFVEEVLPLTDGKGANVILDIVGGDYMARNIACAAMNGRLATIAWLHGSEITLDFRAPMRKRMLLSQSALRARDVAEKSRITPGLNYPSRGTPPSACR